MCGKGTGDSIPNRLLDLLGHNLAVLANNAVTGPLILALSSTMSPANQAKRDFLKLSHQASDQYSGPYDGPITSTVKRKCIQVCDAF